MAWRQLHLQPGSLVVLEGLDRAGKTTQRQKLAALDWATPTPLFTHMPSGLTDVTTNIYALTESATITSALARQLLHLACHAENMTALTRARQERGVILDRWWWSTVAYGWYGNDLGSLGVDEQAFLAMISSVWTNMAADVVFVFTTPFERDDLNRDQVRHGYAELARQNAALTVEVPALDEQATNAFLVEQLISRRLVRT
ncbi:dTMP kinase [Nonomuraea sediminis]|uniref:dTMP kinase n=1 Tax=Nonomuraea sediminis TaxID=2835864 RepID=UPI001BDBD387|nr:hypothetical protein [Nonomuraea sediminis]